MISLFKKFIRSEEDAFLKGWRNSVSDFEQRVLIPGFKLRMENIITVLNRMKLLCQEERTNEILPHVFKAMHNGLGVPIANENEAAKNYINRFDKIIDDDFLNDAKAVLAKFSEEMTLDKFTEILIDIRNYCHGLFAVKNKTFTYVIGFGGVLINANSKDIKTIQPVEANIMWHPFNLHYNELCSIAQSTIESIQEWENSQAKQKNSYLNFMAHRAQLKSFRWSVAVAALFGVVTAWFFFVSNDYMKVRKYERDLEKSEATVHNLEDQFRTVTSEFKHCQSSLRACQSSK